MYHKPIIIACALLALMAKAQAVGPYSYSGDGAEVTDSKTGLIWRRCAEGMSWNSATCTGSATFYTHAEALLHAANEATASGKAWRLPNIKELSSLVDRSRRAPAIDIEAFPAAPWTAFWSSSAHAGVTNYGSAWVVIFGAGYLDTHSRAGGNTVRLVRSDQ